jgi:hypothetical protein
MATDSSNMAADLLIDGRPDWGRISIDVHCSRCEYNLRALTQPRCPECGLEFEWAIVLERAQRHGEALFEHVWRRRPIRSGWRTLILSFFPDRLWSHVTLHDPVRPEPLLLLLSSSLILFLLTLHGGAWLMARGAAWLGGARAWPMASGMSAIAYQYDRIATWPFIGDRRYLHVPFGWMLGVAGATVLLLSIHQTWNQYRLRPVQALRVMAHVALPMAVFAAVIALILAAYIPIRFFSGPLPFLPHAQWEGYASFSSYRGFNVFHAIMFVGGQLLYLLVCVVYLTAGLSGYLRITRAGVVAAVTVFVAALFAYAMLAFFGLVLSGQW